MEKYVEMITQQLEGDVDYLNSPTEMQTDEQYQEALEEVRVLDEIVRANKELDNKHEEEMHKINTMQEVEVQKTKSEARSAIAGHIGNVFKFLGAAAIASVALFKDDEHVFSKQLMTIGEKLSRLL